MAHRRSSARFVEQALDELLAHARRQRESVAQAFDGDAPPEHRIAREPDDAHAALAEHALDLVASDRLRRVPHHSSTCGFQQATL